MTADGRTRYARGLRAAVSLKWVNDALFATDMGTDQFGNDVPDERMFALEDETTAGRTVIKITRP